MSESVSSFLVKVYIARVCMYVFYSKVSKNSLIRD